jgi:RNA polymerase sigma-70 factor (ECF subfamily)
MPWKFGKDHRGPAETPPPELPEDKEIRRAVQALQVGSDPAAAELIFRRYYQPLFNFFSKQRALSEEADDLAQATLLRAFQNIRQCRSGESFRAWLWKIGENVWRNALREGRAVKRSARLETLDSTGPEGGESGETAASRVADEAPTPEQAILAGERQRKLREAIDSLPSGMRRCIRLFFFAELKYREIADVTGVGLNTVRSQLFEARRRLKPVLEKYFRNVDF